jgi:hypothetical protein
MPKVYQSQTQIDEMPKLYQMPNSNLWNVKSLQKTTTF